MNVVIFDMCKNEDIISSTLYLTLPSTFGTFSIVWRETKDGPKIYRIFLSNEQASSEELIQRTFATAVQSSNSITNHLGKLMQSFLTGQAVEFDLDHLAFEVCSEFQRGVLLAEYGIPRGKVSTYGRIGKHLGTKKGARAVGRALAHNPFSIVIPCHRAIRSDSQLGGYQGGLDMKRALLEFEGLKISETGKVLAPRMYY